MPELDYRQKAWSAGLIVLFFVGWELFCLLTGMSDLVLPRPSQVFVTLFQKFPILWPHIIQTLATTMAGFVLGVALGVVLGAVIGVSKTAYDTAYPLLVGFSSIPTVRSPWTFECPRTGQMPAPGLPILPRKNNRFTSCCTLSVPSRCWVMPMP